MGKIYEDLNTYVNPCDLFGIFIVSFDWWENSRYVVQIVKVIKCVGWFEIVANWDVLVVVN